MKRTANDCSLPPLLCFQYRISDPDIDQEGSSDGFSVAQMFADIFSQAESRWERANEVREGKKALRE